MNEELDEGAGHTEVYFYFPDSTFRVGHPSLFLNVEAASMLKMTKEALQDREQICLFLLSRNVQLQLMLFVKRIDLLEDRKSIPSML